MRRGPLAATALFLLFASASLEARPPHLLGAWGGPSAAIAFEGGLAHVRFDCASGTIDEPVSPAKDGSFEARGTYRAGMPGPVRVGQIFTSQPASYSGQVVKDIMTLTVTLEDGTELGPFTLTNGAAPQLVRCL
jgi:hypothetical protein